MAMVGIPRLLRRLPSDVLRLRRRRTAPGKPPTGYVDVYADATGALAGVDDAGAALGIGGTPTGIANGAGALALDGDGNLATALPAGASLELLAGPGDAGLYVPSTGRVILTASAGEFHVLPNLHTTDPGLADAIWSDGGVLVQSGATAPSPGLTRIAQIVGDGTTDTYSVSLPATGDHLQLLAHFPTPGIEGPIGLGIGASGAFAVAPLGTSVECQHIVEWPFFRDATEPMAVVTSMGVDGTFTTALFRGGPMADLDIEVFDAMAAPTNLPTGAVIELWVH